MRLSYSQAVKALQIQRRALAARNQACQRLARQSARQMLNRDAQTQTASA